MPTVPSALPVATQVITPFVIHAYIPPTLNVISLPQSCSTTFTTASPACSQHSPSSIWICSSENLLLRFRLQPSHRATNLISLPADFLSESFPHKHHQFVTAVVTHHLGPIFSLLSDHTIPEPCQCNKLAFCERGIATLREPPHNTPCTLQPIQTYQAHQPQNIRLSLPAPSHAPSRFILITMSGALYFTHSLQSLQLKQPFITLHQPPINAFLSASKTFVTVIGRFRRVFSLAFDTAGESTSHTIILPRAQARFALSQFSYHSVLSQPDQLILQPSSSSPSFKSCPIHITLHSLPILCFTHTIQNSFLHLNESQSISPASPSTPSLRPLLRAIDCLTLRSTEQAAVETNLQQNLSTALQTFATLKSSPLPLSVTLSVSANPRGHVPTFFLPHPPRSKLVYLLVHITNKHSSASLSCFSIGTSFSAQRTKLRSAMPLPTASEGRVRNFLAPIPTLLSGEEAYVSFPLFLSSHAPIHVSTVLSINLPQTEPLEIPLRSELLDIVSFSSKVTGTVQDTSAAVFALPFTQARRATMQHSRLVVPYPCTHVREVLSLQERPMHFQTLLGAPFSLLLSGDDTGTISLRSPTHITPFLRAALLRRLAETKPEPLIVRGVSNIRAWQKGVIDSTEACLNQYSKAEDKLVEAAKVFDVLENGGDGDERGVWKDTLWQATEAYRAWRRETETMWTPMGSGSLGRSVD